MELSEEFRNDPKRKEMLQSIINAYDNAIISHHLDENQNVIAVYDKYSNMKINKLICELRQYEYQKFDIKGGVFPHPLVLNGRLYEPVVNVEKVFNIENATLENLEKELKKALEKEDFQACEDIQKQINKLKK
jgi:hypothetical protein